MKKILLTLGAATTIAVSTSSVVACGTGNSGECHLSMNKMLIRIKTEIDKVNQKLVDIVNAETVYTNTVNEWKLALHPPGHMVQPNWIDSLEAKKKFMDNGMSEEGATKASDISNLKPHYVDGHVDFAKVGILGDLITTKGKIIGNMTEEYNHALWDLQENIENYKNGGGELTVLMNNFLSMPNRLPKLTTVK